MLGPDTGRARIRFSNANGSQQPIVQNYSGITIQNVSDIFQPYNSKKIIMILDLLGIESNVEKNKIQFYIYDDGTIEKKLILE